MADLALLDGEVCPNALLQVLQKVDFEEVAVVGYQKGSPQVFIAFSSEDVVGPLFLYQRAIHVLQSSMDYAEGEEEDD